MNSKLCSVAVSAFKPIVNYFQSLRIMNTVRSSSLMIVFGAYHIFCFLFFPYLYNFQAIKNILSSIVTSTHKVTIIENKLPEVRCVLSALGEETINEA